jgi:hypothetical protein
MRRLPQSRRASATPEPPRSRWSSLSPAHSSSAAAPESQPDRRRTSTSTSDGTGKGTGKYEVFPPSVLKELTNFFHTSGKKPSTEDIEMWIALMNFKTDPEKYPTHCQGITVKRVQRWFRNKRYYEGTQKSNMRAAKEEAEKQASAMRSFIQWNMNRQRATK